MGLASALSTALTGLAAAETTIDVVGNNLANSNTVGFKASQANFATQFLQTRSLGSAPTTNNGGNNPRQIGLGTMVADITPNFNQGTIEISANPTDLAIQGDGFFIVQGDQGETFYTRNGIFKMNADNEMITIAGNRLLGFGVDDQFQIETTSLQPISIPLGSAAVAQATGNVFLEGTLSPTGDLADTAEIIQTGVLGDASWSAPGTGTTLSLSSAPNVTGSTLSGGGGGAMTAGTYFYRVVFADGSVGSITDSEGVPSGDINTSITINGTTQTSVTLSNLPVDSDYSFARIYRSNDGSTYRFVSEQAMPAGAWNFTDTTADAGLGNTLDQATISGAYSYYVTFADAAGGPSTGNESRPTQKIGSLTASGDRIQLQNLPVDTSGQWSVRRIYRNLSTDDNTFYYVGEIADATTTGLSFTDNASDTTISANPQIDLDGPKITNATLLTDILRRDESTYNQVFQTGTLAFTGRKGGRALATKQLTVSSTTTVLELLNFMEEAFGIRSVPGPDPLNPITDGDPSSSVTLNPGGSVTSDGRIRLVGNNGDDNAIEIRLAEMQLTTTNGTANVDLPFSSAQTADGESAVADLIVYDTLGVPLSVRLTMVLESRNNTSTTYRWFADSPDNDPTTGVEIAVGTGLVTFDSEGRFLTTTEATVAIDRRNVSSASPLEFELDFSQISGLSTDNSTLAVTRQDGSGAGVLSSFIVGEDGTIRGVFSNGVTRDLAQIRLARFGNPAGLEQKGQSLYAPSVNSGLPVEGNPGDQGIGSIIAGAVELSNTDIGANLIDLILASTMYRGNTRVITTAQQLFDELLALRR